MGRIDEGGIPSWGETTQARPLGGTRAACERRVCSRPIPREAPPVRWAGFTDRVTCRVLCRRLRTYGLPASLETRAPADGVLL